MPCFILGHPWTGWREEARREKRPKARLKNSPHPGNETLGRAEPPPYQKPKTTTDSSERNRMKPVELYCKEVSELGVDGARVIDRRSVVTAEWVRIWVPRIRVRSMGGMTG